MSLLPERSRLNRNRGVACLLALGLFASACTGSDPSPQNDAAPSRNATDQTDPDEEGGTADPLPEVAMTLRPGPFQLTVDAMPEGLSTQGTIEVISSSGELIGSGGFAENGTALIRDLPPGNVMIEVVDGRNRFSAGRVEIQGEAVEDADLYQETELEAGFNYIPTRDGTELSAFVSLPGSAVDGPYPTLVEYSGYSPSDPTAAADPYRLLIPSLGYALVQVNVRGTGCSGGSFDAFERIQSLDGYDVIETVAAQPWSAKVGMFGVSYPGIMQLHVASTQPPSLSAIAPLSPMARVDSVLYPGGIFNNGFGEDWSEQVSDRAEAGGQPWAADRVARGDQTCGINQELRVHNPDLVSLAKQTPFINELTRSRSAETYAAAIRVPTFIGGAWQDEQTGGRFPAILDELEAAPVLRAVLYNGLHIDAISAEMLVKLIEFFNLYVGDLPPEVPPVARLLIGVGLSGFFGDSLELPPGSFDGLSVEEARRQFEAAPPIEVLFEQGATAPNLPVPSFRAGFEAWPPPTAEPIEYFLADGGEVSVLTSSPSQEDGSHSYVTDPGEGQRSTAPDLEVIWTNQPGWEWPAPAAGASVIATGDRLQQDIVAVGNASADLWVSVADGSDADLEVTISEVAPDGSETYVQSGWLRLSRRALAGEATALRPVISGLEADVAPVRAGGEPVLARVEILPFAHVFRSGSRLRMTVDTPGASKPQWRFDVADTPVTVTLHSGPDYPSKLVLSSIPNLEIPTERPACGSLRGQPCRRG